VPVVFVGHGDVIEDVFLRFEHAAGAVFHDRGQLVAEARVVGPAVGNARCSEVRRAVLVLKALAGERRAAGGPADEKAARARIARGPN